MKTNIVYADLSEILFEGRNKSYGGYFLRQTSNSNLLKGLATAVSIFLFLFLIFRNKDVAIEIINLNEPLIATIIPIDLTEKTVEPEPPKMEAGASKPEVKADITPKPESQEFLNPTPKPDDEVKKDVTMLNSDSIKVNPGDETVAGGTGTGPGGPGGPGTGPGPGDEKEKVDPNKIYEDNFGLSSKPFATNMSELKKCIRYPRELLEFGVEGKVEMKLLVNKEGKVEEIKVVRATHPLFGEACKTCMKKLIFEPGKMGDAAVKVWVTIPFIFRSPN